MAKKSTSTKKPNAPDLTLRNLHAEKKREAAIVKRLDDLEARNLKFGPRLQRLEEQVREMLDNQAILEKRFGNLLKREDERSVTNISGVDPASDTATGK